MSPEQKNPIEDLPVSSVMEENEVHDDLLHPDNTEIEARAAEESRKAMEAVPSWANPVLREAAGVNAAARFKASLDTESAEKQAGFDTKAQAVPDSLTSDVPLVEVSPEMPTPVTLEQTATSIDRADQVPYRPPEQAGKFLG